MKFKCNFCKSNADFEWLDGYSTAAGFRVYQCLKCCAIGTKNLDGILKPRMVDIMVFLKVDLNT